MERALHDRKSPGLTGGQPQAGLNEMLAWLRQKRWQSMSFGGIVYLVLLVPVVNLLMMPAAVAGATLFWVREQGAEAMAKS